MAGQPTLRLDVGGGHLEHRDVRRRAQAVEDFNNGWTPATTVRSDRWGSRLDVLNDGLDIATVDRGVTAGIARPGRRVPLRLQLALGGRGLRGLFANLASFAPMAKGGSIHGVVQRAPGGGPTGFSPFLFLCCQGNARSTTARTCSALRRRSAPHRAPQGRGDGGPALTDGPGVLLKSAASFAQATWLHLRLDVIVNTNGDVVLKVFRK